MSAHQEGNKNEHLREYPTTLLHKQTFYKGKSAQWKDSQASLLI